MVSAQGRRSGHDDNGAENAGDGVRRLRERQENQAEGEDGEPGKDRAVRHNDRLETQQQRVWPGMGAAFAIGCAAALIVAAATFVVQLRLQVAPLERIADPNPGRAMLLFVAVTCGGIGEEIIFRCALMSYLAVHRSRSGSSTV